MSKRGGRVTLFVTLSAVVAAAVLFVFVFGGAAAPINAKSLSDGSGVSEAAVSALPNTVDNGGNPVDGVLPDGKLPSYDPKGTGIEDWSQVKSTPGGTFFLKRDITITSLDTTTNFTGVLDGAGKTIYLDIDFPKENEGLNYNYVGGLFAQLSENATIKNINIVVNKFRCGTKATVTRVGMIAGHAEGTNINVQNVSITLNYSPKNMVTRENGDTDAYLYHTQQSAKGSTLMLGGVFGSVKDNVNITDTTVNNQTTDYGFSMLGWREGGSIFGHSNGFHYLGGFVGANDGASLNIKNCTLAGNANSKFYVFSESTSSHRYNSGFLGGVLGYLNEGSMAIDGFIMSYPAQLDINMQLVNMKWDDDNEHIHRSLICGYKDGPTSCTMRNLYFVNTAQTTQLLVDPGRSNPTGVVQFDASLTPRFDGNDNIAFWGAKKVAPDSSELVYQIFDGMNTVNVMDALMLKDNEQSQQVWLSVPKCGKVTDGSDTQVNMQAAMAVHGTLGIDTSYTLSSDKGDAYTVSYVYNGTQPVAPVLQLKENGVVTNSLSGVYSENSPNANAGIHTLAYNSSALTGYTVVQYQGRGYLIKDNKVYSPETVTVGGTGVLLDFTNNFEINIEKKPVTVSLQGEGSITYGDTENKVRDLFTAVCDGLVPGETIKSYTLGGYYQGTPVGSGTVDISVSSLTLEGGVQSNYDITYEKKSVTINPMVLKGNITVSNLEYNGMQKNAVFTLTEGTVIPKDNGKGYLISYSGNRLNAGDTFTVTVEPNPLTEGNYDIQVDPAEFTITRKNITIQLLQDNLSIPYNGGVVADFHSYFKATGVNNKVLDLYFEEKNGLTVQHAGVYTVVARLSEEETNYTATNDGELELTVTIEAIEGEIGLTQGNNIVLAYDGTAISGDDFYEYFTPPNAEFGIPAILDYEILKNGLPADEVKGAGTYTVTAKLSEKDAMDYIAQPMTVTFTVQAVQLSDVTFDLPENTVYDGQPKIVTATVNSGVLGDDAVTLSVRYDSQEEAPSDYKSGGYVITAVSDNPDYVIADSVKSTLNITKKTASISAEEKTSVYGNELAALTAVVTGNVEGETLEYTLQITPADKYVAGGSYTVSVILTPDSAVNANYDISVKSAAYTVTRKEISVSIGAEMTGEYKAEAYGFTPVYAGTEEGDDVSVTVTSDKGEVINAGEYVLKLNVSGADRSNYNFTLDKEYTFTVSKAQPVVSDITVKTENLHTNDPLPVMRATVRSAAGVDIAGQFVWTEKTLQEGEHEYNWTFMPSDTANYLQATGTYTLTAKTVIVQSIDISGDYKKDYVAYDTFDRTNLIVTVTYNDLTSEEIADFAIDNEDRKLEVSDTAVVVSVGGKTAQVPITVKPKVVAVPDISIGDYTYSGKEYVIEVAENEYYVISGNKAENAGGYTLTVALISKENCVWDQGGSDDITREWNIKAKSVVITGRDGSQQYSGLQISDFSEYFTAPMGVDSLPLELTFSVAEGKSVKNAGEYSVTATLAPGQDNYDCTDGYTITFTVTAAEVEILTNSSKTVKYSGTAFEDYADMFTAPHGIGDDSDTLLNITFTIRAGGETVDEIKGVGVYTVEASLADVTGNYTASSVQTTYTVEPQPVDKPVIEPGSIVYNGAEQTVDVKADGRYTVQGNKGTDAGSYEITVTLNDSVNYVWSSGGTAPVTKQWSIAPKPVKITVLQNKEAVYKGGAYTDYAFMFSPPADIDSHNLALDYVIEDASGEPVGEIKTAGVYKVRAKLSAGQDNYQAEEAVATYTVKPKGVEVPTVQGNYVYNGAEQTVALSSYENFIVTGGDKFTDAGNYRVRLSLTDPLNYEWNDGSGNQDKEVIWSIKVKDVTLATTGDVSREYDGTADYDLSDYVVSGTEELYGRDNMTVSVTVPSIGKDRGDYSLQIEVSGEKIGNYNIVCNNTHYYKITPKSVNLSVEDAHKEFDGQEYDFTDYLVSGTEGFVAADSVQCTVHAEDAAAAAGRYKLVITTTADSDSNYSINRSGDKYLIISPKKVVITAGQDGGKIYDGKQFSDYASMFTAPVGIGGEELVLSFRVTKGDAESVITDAGVYTVTATLAAGQPDYTAEEVSVTYTVEKLSVTVSASGNVEKQYDGTADYDFAEYIAAGVSGMEGFFERDNIKAVITIEDAQPSLGEYKLVLSVTGEGAGNYNTECICDGILTIVARRVTLTGENVSKEYDGLLYDFSEYAVQGSEAFVEGDDIVITVTAGETKTPGNYPITVSISGDDAACYAVDPSLSAQLTITPREITQDEIIIEGTETVYDGTHKEVGVTFTPGTVVEGDHINVTVYYDSSKFSPVDVKEGGYKLTFESGNPYYVIAEGVTATLTISKAKPVLFIETEKKEYVAGDALPAISLGKNSTRGQISWTDAQATLQAGENAYAWTFLPEDTRNIEGASGVYYLSASSEKIIGLEVATAPDKTEYKAYEKFDTAGLTLKVTYEDYDYETVSEGFTLGEESGEAVMKAGDTHVTVYYGGMSVTVDVTVDRGVPEVSEVTVTGEAYAGGELPGLEAVVTYMGEPVRGVISLEDGQVLIEGSGEYNWIFIPDDIANISEVRGVVTIEVGPPQLVRIEVTGGRSEYTAFETFDVDGYTITGYTADGQTKVITEGYTVKGYPQVMTVSGTGGKVTVTFDYAGVSVDFEVKVLPKEVVIGVAEGVEHSRVYDGKEITDVSFLFTAPQGNDMSQLALEYRITGVSSKLSIAGNYKIIATLKAGQPDYTAKACEVTYVVERADIEMDGTFTQTLGNLVVSAPALGIENVEYSMDGTTWSKVPADGKINVLVQQSYKIWLRYVQTANYNQSEAVCLEQYIEKEVLSEYIAQRFSADMTFADVPEYLKVIEYAQVAQGESETFENRLAELNVKYNVLIGGVKEVAEGALRAGAKLSGRQAAAVAAASATGMGILAAGVLLAVRRGRGGKKDEEE